MKKVVFWTLALLLTMGSCYTGFCADNDDEGEKVYAIQERIYHRNHELSVMGGYIPNEDFYEAFPVGLGYTFNFNEYFSWEVARGQYVFTSEKELKKDIEEEADLTPSLFAEPKYMVHSHLVFRPFYGKAAVVNRGIVNRETYLFLGGGVVSYEWQTPDGTEDNELVNSISFGLGTKYFINENLCMNLEIRDLVNIWDNDTDNRIYFGIGFGFRFNLLPRKMERDSDVDRMNEYLKKSAKDDE